MYKRKPIDVFYPGLEGSGYYRIPTISRLGNGNILLGCDQRIDTESDYGGLIEPVIRIREEAADKFSDIIKVMEAPKGSYTSPSYTIDMCLAPDIDNPDTVYMLIDKFKSNGNYQNSKKGTGFIEKNGEKYQILFKHQVNSLLFNKEDGRYYIKDGKVYDMDDRITTYEVVTEDSYPYDKIGDLYKDGAYISNIYLDSSELTVHQSPYLFFSVSHDGGKTFSSPVDITSHIATDDMMFIGTSPGRGITLTNGRIIFPIYYTVENPDDIYRNIEKAAVIFSDDGGKSWEISHSITDLANTSKRPIDTSESTIVHLSDERLIIFARSTADRVVYAVSKDKGTHFGPELKFVDFESEPFCMLSACTYEKDGKEYILLSNPKGPGRTNGSIKVMEVCGDELVTIKEKEINSSTFSYSVIERIDDKGVFGLVYEQKEVYQRETREHIKYTEFDFEWIFS